MTFCRATLCLSVTQALHSIVGTLRREAINRLASRPNLDGVPKERVPIVIVIVIVVAEGPSGSLSCPKAVTNDLDELARYM